MKMQRERIRHRSDPHDRIDSYDRQNRVAVTTVVVLNASGDATRRTFKHGGATGFNVTAETRDADTRLTDDSGEPGGHDLSRLGLRPQKVKVTECVPWS